MTNKIFTFSRSECSLTEFQILCYFITFAEIERIQKLTRRALDMTWRNSLSHDWISPDKAKPFP